MALLINMVTGALAVLLAWAIFGVSGPAILFAVAAWFGMLAASVTVTQCSSTTFRRR